VQLALLGDDRPICSVEAAGEPVVDTAPGVIRFTGALRTASLEPGTYTVVGMLPNFETRSVKQVEQRFLLISRSPRVRNPRGSAKFDPQSPIRTRQFFRYTPVVFPPECP
jgi:hypothetical protein